MTVQELSRKINNDIHNRMFQPNHFKEVFGDYEKCFTSLDLIEDCQDAIDEFKAIPETKIPNRSVLNIYGVLQATFCQQDGLYGLYQNISRKKFKSISDFFTQFDFDNKNREIRNDIVGHPSTRKVNGKPEFYFIDKGPNSKYKFSYAGYSPDFVVKKVDLKKIIDEQNNLANNVLIKVIKMINEKINQHKEKHKSESLHSIVSTLNYSIQLIKRGYSDTQRAFQAEGNIKIVTSKMKEVEEELKKRFRSSIPESVEYTLGNIYYILEQMGNWYENNELLGKKDAEIFMIAFDKEFDELGIMLKEIDEEY
ncbi:hypothetical protein [Psychroflexus tropicus]|uniref:hypothetical protein n=1 Tax=Psychroflexus tropicus TaxID=197345 RepID=UPI0003818BDA|nr:hypothetical protein [Psychroflexus tropicus]